MSKNYHRQGPDESQSLPADLVTSLRRSLLRWYDRCKRNLPWRRRQGDPYAQWVAEIMLQQTRVETVIEYYDRFMKRFPTIKELARADHNEVLTYWQGLGYYRRILYLHKACIDLCSNKSTQLKERGAIHMPTSAEELRSLRGVGDYTAAAIASIAYKERVAAVDGNVARVIARLFAIESDILSNAAKREIQRIADQLISKSRPGDFNQAWMDLGSAVCTPQNPDCDVCPLAEKCQALASGSVGRLPRRAGQRKLIPLKTMVLICVCGESHLFRQRPTGGLWSGLWEYPNAELAVDNDAILVARKLVRELGIQSASRARRLDLIKHTLSHRRITFYPVLITTKIKTVPAPHDNGLPYRWANAQEPKNMGLSTAHRKIREAVLARLHA